MATEQHTEVAAPATAGRGLVGQIELHSIDWIPESERHGKPRLQAIPYTRHCIACARMVENGG